MSSGWPTNGPGGPFSGHEVAAALADVDCRHIETTEENVAVFVCDDSGANLFIDLDRQIFYGDPFFLNTARLMVDRRIAGRTFKDLVESKMRALRAAIVRRRAEGEPYEFDKDLQE